MPLPRGQVDRFGNPIPPNQSVKVWINSDGTVPQQRETVKLDSTITATDDPDSQATILSATGAASGSLLIANNLSELTATASTARTNLGLGTASTQAIAAFDAAGAAAAAQAASQPLDSDLTAIAALTTTAFGRSLLTLANQAALNATIPFVVLSNTVFTGASVTIPFTANTYKRIDVTIDWGAGTLDTIALTGMDAAKYNNGFNYATGIASANTSDLDNWPKPAGSTAGKGFAKFTVSVPPAPALKGLEFNGCYVNIPATIRGVHTDTTHDPTAIVVTFDASRTGYVYAIGYK